MSKPNPVECVQGNYPIILISPHGGDILFPNIPRSQRPQDRGTHQFIESVSKLLNKQFNLIPYTIQSNIHPQQLDCNRPRDKCTQDSGLLKYYDLFHYYITLSITKCLQEFDKAFLLDIHSHAHNHGCVELGYDLNRNVLKTIENPTSLSSLNGYFPEMNLVNGRDSLGTILTNNGIPSIPSLQKKYPTTEEKYFKGGFITQTYKNYCKDVGIIQVEIYFKYLRFPEVYVGFVDDFVRSLVHFLRNLNIIIQFPDTY